VLGKGSLPNGNGSSPKWGRVFGERAAGPSRRPSFGLLGSVFPPVWCLFCSGLVFVFVRSGVRFRPEWCFFHSGRRARNLGARIPSESKWHFSEGSPKLSEWRRKFFKTSAALFRIFRIFGKMRAKIFRIFGNSFGTFCILFDLNAVDAVDPPS